MELKKWLLTGGLASVMILGACGQDATEPEEDENIDEPVEDNVDDAEGDQNDQDVTGDPEEDDGPEEPLGSPDDEVTDLDDEEQEDE